jgi:hypothetical protein
VLERFNASDRLLRGQCDNRLYLDTVRAKVMRVLPRERRMHCALDRWVR